MFEIKGHFCTFIQKSLLKVKVVVDYGPFNGIGGRPYMTSDGRGEGSDKSDFISKGSLIKHLMRGKGGQKLAKFRRHIWTAPNPFFNVRQDSRVCYHF